MKGWHLVLAGALSAAWASSAWCQPVGQSSAVAAPDVVRTKSGDLYRGTISEKTTEVVEIVLITGKTRSLPMTDVEYAGPVEGLPKVDAAGGGDAESQPVEGASHSGDGARNSIEVRTSGEPKPIVTVNAKEANLSLESVPEGITFHRRAASAGAPRARGGLKASAVGYEEMCTAPCNVTMPSGTHTFALSSAGDACASSLTHPDRQATLR